MSAEPTERIIEAIEQVRVTSETYGSTDGAPAITRSRHYRNCLDAVAELNASIAALSEADAKRIAELEADRKRYQWAANELLACDYGDNDQQPPTVGWRVYGWRARGEDRRIYGPSIDAAIDAELARLSLLLSTDEADSPDDPPASNEPLLPNSGKRLP